LCSEYIGVMFAQVILIKIVDIVTLFKVRFKHDFGLSRDRFMKVSLYSFLLKFTVPK
jgi:hypothetical protein